MVSKVEKLAGLKRKLSITVPVEAVKQAYQKRLKEVAKNAELKGFRKGKVPLNVVEQRFSAGIRQEVANDLVQSSFQLAVNEHSLEVVSRPTINLSEIKVSEPLEYDATFEVYPNVQLNELAGEKFEKHVTNITEQDIDKMVNKLRRQHAKWSPTDEKAVEGDLVVIDFEGRIDNELFEGGAAKDFRVEIGSKQMIPGFEEGLIGTKVGDARDVSVTFPKDYGMEKLAGKPAVFHIIVKEVNTAELPEVDETFVENIGMTGTVESFRDEVRASMEREVAKLLITNLKNQVLDRLVEKNPLELPEALIENEILNLQAMTRQQMVEYQRMSEEQARKFELPRDPYVEQATQRVKLGLLLSEVIKQYEIKVDPAKLREKVVELASGYQKPDDVVNWYYSNKKALSEVEGLVLEDQAVTKLLDNAEVIDKTISYEEAIKQSNSNSNKGAS